MSAINSCLNITGYSNVTSLDDDDDWSLLSKYIVLRYTRGMYSSPHNTFITPKHMENNSCTANGLLDSTNNTYNTVRPPITITFNT